jgi:predicted acetyltransferase
MNHEESEPECHIRESSAESGRPGTEDVEFLLSGRRVSSCRIIPLRLRVGASVVRMDGIGEVRTEEEYRYRGFARRVMSQALRRMETGDAALTMLYGIKDFYPKFGYITVGPDSRFSLPPLDEAPLPDSHHVRPFSRADLKSVQQLYDHMTATSVGTALRPQDGYPWTELLSESEGGTSTGCQVMTDADGRVRAYVWHGQKLGFVRAHSRFRPDDFVVGEVVAADTRSAEVALTLCRRWAAEEGTRRHVKQVTFFAPHEGPVASAARHMPATLARAYGPDGGWMARVLSTSSLFASLQPELSRRLAAAHNRFRGTLQVLTDAGDATLSIDADGVRSAPGAAAAGDHALACRLPQTTLAQLAVGCFPPDDLLARVPQPLEDRAIELLQMMFPPRPAQLFLADRF